MKKVVWISSYLTRSCGIAYYSDSYISALKKYFKKTNKKISIKIIAHTDATLADYPIIDNESDKKWHYKVFEVVKKEKPDVVHIQHEYGMYETYGDNNQRVIDLIKMIRERGIPVVMTYHSVYRKLKPPHKKFVSESLKILDAGILHEDYQKNSLPSNISWKPKNIYVLPHGSREDFKESKDKIRKEMDYGKNDLIVGSAGLADERKGFRTLVRQWPKVIKKIPNAKLVLEVKPLFAPQTKIYISELMKVIMESPVSRNIALVVKDYGSEEFYRRLRSFDVLVLPYKSESQSGVLAHGFATGTPAIVTDIEGLGAEIRNSKAGIAVKKREDFYKAIIKMLKSKKLRDRYSKNALDYVKKVNGWNIIAKKTFDIWKEVQKD